MHSQIRLGLWSMSVDLDIFPSLLFFQNIYWSLNTFWLGFCWLPFLFLPVLEFSEIACLSLFQFPSSKVLDTCIAQEAAPSHNLRRDFIGSKKTTDCKLKARAGNADTWSRRLRLTILGIQGRAHGEKRSRFNQSDMCVAIARLHLYSVFVARRLQTKIHFANKRW